jgi:hypothetical protein
LLVLIGIVVTILLVGILAFAYKSNKPTRDSKTFDATPW